MNLIDADKLMKSLKPNESVWVGLVLSELIDNAPTVKAIPTEWIEKWLNETETRDKITCYDIRDMIEDWEKENENRVE